MSTITDKVMFDVVAHYWAPKSDYSSAEAASNWSALVTAGDFTVWSRSLANSQDPAKFVSSVNSTLELDIPSMSIVTRRQKHRRVPIKLFPPAKQSPPYLGHNPSDHVFRLDASIRTGKVEDCLKYEGQIPLSRNEYRHRFEAILPDTIDMAVCVLTFVPKVNRRRRTLVPDYLQAIRNKTGKINQDDLELLLHFWEGKFSDWDHRQGAETTIRTSEVIPQPVLHRTLPIIAEAAFLLNRLQLSQDRFSWKPTFDFTSLIHLLEKLADKPLTKLLRMHHDKMNNEGLKILHGLSGNPDQVLVYCTKEDIPHLDATFNNEGRRPNKDDHAAELSKWRWGADAAAAPDRPGSKYKYRYNSTPGATEAAKDQLVRRFGWFADPLKSSTFHQFYQHQQRQKHNRDLVNRAGSSVGSSSSSNSIQRALSKSNDRRPISENLLPTSRLITPPLDEGTRDTIFVSTTRRKPSPSESSSSPSPSQTPSPPPTSSRVDDKQPPRSSQSRFRRPQIGDKGVAVPKNFRSRGSRVEKRTRKTPSTAPLNIKRFFKI